LAGLYLHIPFCKQACHYCDFHFSTSLKHKEPLLAALSKELYLRRDELATQTVESIYIGGGTPSLLAGKELATLLTHIDRYYAVSPEAEITLECNPDDLSAQKINDLSALPINRLSIGIQSFNQADLTLMNRAHSAEEATKSLALALRKFDNITIDLIYGIPHMSAQQWQSNLDMAFDFGVPHLSAYALTVEERTALHHFIQKGSLAPLEETRALQHFEMLMEAADKQGLIHYEISNFGKEAYLSKHNTAYWQRKPYMGVGPSAHSFNGHQRSWNIANNSRYIKAIQASVLPRETEILTQKDRFNERIMTGLRTVWGVSLSEIASDFGEQYQKELLKNAQVYMDQHLLLLDETGQLTASNQAKFLIDGIASDLFVLSE
jgi:oxygen-independent coproporphyrinogen-3 oxidase